MNGTIGSHPVSAGVLRAMGLLVSAVVALVGDAAASECPFCSAASRTLTEDIQLSDVGVLARLASPDDADLDSGDAKFQVERVLRGEDVLGGRRDVETVFFGEPDTKQVFLITGIGTDYTQWATPLPLSTAGIEYLARLPELPDSGADRLEFFQEYLEHDDPLLAQDAYEEFARAPYAVVHDLAPRMHRDRLVAWIKDPEVNPTRRRLYLTMLGACGSDADLPMLEEMIVSSYQEKRPLVEPLVYGGLAMGGPLELPTWSEFIELDERRKKLGLDALVACYMVLRGPEGLDLIDKRLLEDPSVEYSHVYSAIMALRFLGEETEIVPRERLLASMRLLLDKPDFADQVIPDLARWEDWSVLEKLVAMFKASDSAGYVRLPIVAYLLAAAERPAPVGKRAEAALAELEQVDAETVRQAKSTMAFGFLARARSLPSAASAIPSEAVAAGDDAAENNKSADRPVVADDVGAEAKPSEPGAIPPDPANFDAKLAENAAADASDGDASGRPVATVEAKATAPSDLTAASAASSNDAPSSAAPPAATEASPTAPNMLLVIGLPLGAFVLLVGVYWVILRSGAT